jgi:hypothetical protein
VEKTDDQKAIESEPGDNVKEWIDEEGTDFDDKLDSPKKMAEKDRRTD